MAKAIHSMIRVLEEGRSVKFYKTAFDLSVTDRLDIRDFTLLYLSNSESSFELELTVNKKTTQPYDLGTGYGHLAFSVEDLDTERRCCKTLSLKDSQRESIWLNGVNE
ncbi:VOC family protein [Ruegeria hyattellae]|uniref:VOC family protein n=1 Tax=Ruegeria hyattellae TaxID=3233337 RepID=UPI00355AE76C